MLKIEAKILERTVLHTLVIIHLRPHEARQQTLWYPWSDTKVQVWPVGTP